MGIKEMNGSIWGGFFSKNVSMRLVSSHSQLISLQSNRVISLNSNNVQMTATRNFHHNFPVCNRLRLPPLQKPSDDNARPKTTAINGYKSGVSRSRVLFYVEDLADFMERALMVMGVMKGDLQKVAVALSSEGQAGVEKFVNLCEGNLEVDLHEDISNAVDGSKKDDHVLLHRSTIESLLQYASDFDVNFPRGVYYHYYYYLFWSIM